MAEENAVVSMQPVMAVAGPIFVVCEFCLYAVAAAAVALVITSVRRLILH